MDGRGAKYGQEKSNWVGGEAEVALKGQIGPE